MEYFDLEVTPQPALGVVGRYGGDPIDNYTKALLTRSKKNVIFSDRWMVAGTCNHRELTLPPVPI